MAVLTWFLGYGINFWFWIAHNLCTYAGCFNFIDDWYAGLSGKVDVPDTSCTSLFGHLYVRKFYRTCLWNNELHDLGIWSESIRSQSRWQSGQTADKKKARTVWQRKSGFSIWIGFVVWHACFQNFWLVLICWIEKNTITKNVFLQLNCFQSLGRAIDGNSSPFPNLFYGRRFGQCFLLNLPGCSRDTLCGRVQKAAKPQTIFDFSVSNR